MNLARLLSQTKAALVVGALGGVVGLASPVYGAVQCFAVGPAPAGCTGVAVPIGNAGTTVNATATFEVSGSNLLVTLTNLLKDPTSVSQLISDVFFTVSGTTSGGGLVTTAANLITVNENRTFTTSTGTTSWLLTQQGSIYHLDVLAGAASGPENLIIGPPANGGTYASANGSIAGNGPHNPFINLSQTFSLALTGLTGDTTVTDVAISFGTTPSFIPIPAAVWLFGSGLLGLIGIARRKRNPSLAPA